LWLRMWVSDHVSAGESRVVMLRVLPQDDYEANQGFESCSEQMKF